MSLRSVRQVPQDKAELAQGMLSRLIIALLIAVVSWFQFDEFSQHLSIVAIGIGVALGYAFAHSRTRARHRLRSIGSWVFYAGFILTVCAVASRVLFAEQPFVVTTSGTMLVALALPITAFGISLLFEYAKL